MDESTLMKRVLRLAGKGTGRVSPNPRVGALIVRNGEILSQGYHRRYGGPHAEINALRALNGASARDATMIVNLEPCSHFGKTPPCADAIIRAGISRVVIGIEDPNPEVAGQGIARLKKSGIRVVTGVLADACTELNRSYIKYVQTGMPYVTLKVAQSLDGRIAVDCGKSKWITGEKAREEVQHIRRQNDAVLVGVETVKQDDPRLTIRTKPAIQSRRIVLDSRLRIPEQARILNTSETEHTLILTTDQAEMHKAEHLREQGIAVQTVRSDFSGRVDLKAALKKLGQAGLASVLVEGGSRVFSAFVQQKLVDELIVFIAPVGFGSGLRAFELHPISEPAEAFSFTSVSWKRVGKDMMFRGRMECLPD